MEIPPGGRGFGEGWERDKPVSIPIHDPGEDVVCVCTCAYEEQEGEEKGLKVEEGELEEWVSYVCPWRDGLI